MNTYSMDERLGFSRGVRESTDLATIKKMIPGCVSVVKTDEQQDKNGIDYIATLRRGREINIDAKAREAGCSVYWNDGPEVALEIWSVKPLNGHRGKTGWTLDESKETELVLFTFDPQDCPNCYLVSFQLLRIAFRKNILKWIDTYRVATQKSKENGRMWQSQCVFVPVDTVYDAMRDVSIGEMRALVSGRG
jgi:hypothetical protein